MADPSDSLSSNADSQTTGLLINLATGIPTTLLCLILFDPLRRNLPKIFEARRQAALPIPNSPSRRPFAWLLPTIKYPLSTLLHSHGADAGLFLRYLRFQFTLFLLLHIPATLLLPLYYTASNKSLPTDNPLRTAGVNKFSLANVPRDDSVRFWLLLVAEYGIAVFVAAQLLLHFSLYCRDRRRYRASNIPANYAVLVQDIPKHSCSESSVRKYWERLFPKEVARVFFVQDARRLEKIKKRFWQAVEKREVAELKAHRAAQKEGFCGLKKSDQPVPENIQEGSSEQMSHSSMDTDSESPTLPPPTIEEAPGTKPKPRLLGAPRNAQAAVQYWRALQTEYSVQVAEQQCKKDEADFPATRSAIVVFTTRYAASIAAQTNFSRRENEWRVCRAPEPEAVDWAQMAVNGSSVYVRQAATALLSTGLTLFWIVPVTAVMGLANLSKLAQIEINGNKPFLFLEDVKNWSEITTGFIESWLPSLILIVFLNIVPKVFELFVSISRIPSKAKQDSMVRDWYFVFVTFSNFLFVAFAGTLLEELAAIIDRPARTVEILASNIPKQAAFMMNFIILSALSEAPRELLQVGRVGGRWAKLAFGPKTDRQREKIDCGDPEMNYVKFYAFSQLVSLLGIVYSTIQPFIIPCCMAYFGISYVVFKYNLSFSLHNEYEDGGRMYGGALYAVWLGLFAHLLTMIGVFGLNKSPAQSALIIIPTVLSVLYLLHCRKSFDRVIEHGSALETQDVVDGLEGPDFICKGLLESYLHPGFEELPRDVENKSGVLGKSNKNDNFIYGEEEFETNNRGEQLESIVSG